MMPRVILKSIPRLLPATLLVCLVAAATGCKKKTGEVIDRNGIPYYIYHKQGKQRNPLFIGAKALEYSKETQAENDSARVKFNNCVNWLEQHLLETDSMVSLPYTFPVGAYNLEPPWFSGLANSRCVEVFMKAYEFSGDSHYIELCEKLLTSFTVPTALGGNLCELHGDDWYAEYASAKIQSPFVLNGMISTIVSIDRYHQKFPSERSERLVKRGIETVKKNLYRFNNNGLSYYNLDSNEAHRNYYRIHVKQMVWMHDLTNDPRYLEMRSDWIDYYNASLQADEVPLEKNLRP